MASLKKGEWLELGIYNITAIKPMRRSNDKPEPNCQGEVDMPAGQAVSMRAVRTGRSDIHWCNGADQLEHRIPTREIIPPGNPDPWLRKV